MTFFFEFFAPFVFMIGRVEDKIGLRPDDEGDLSYPFLENRLSSSWVRVPPTRRRVPEHSTSPV